MKDLLHEFIVVKIYSLGVNSFLYYVRLDGGCVHEQTVVDYLHELCRVTLDSPRKYD